MASLYERIYSVVRRIPRGRVATYGQVAALAGIPLHARQVGYALNALPANTPLPWHRVINAQGQISLRGSGVGEQIQRIRLQREGVRFDRLGRVDLRSFGWRPRSKRRDRKGASDVGNRSPRRQPVANPRRS